MIIESGFASVTRLIKHLGLPSRGIDLRAIEEERLAMIREITLPALIIHGEEDNLVPLQEGRELYQFLASPRKKWVVIPNADHNSVMLHGLETYSNPSGSFWLPEVTNVDHLKFDDLVKSSRFKGRKN